MSLDFLFWNPPLPVSAAPVGMQGQGITGGLCG